MRVDSKKEKKKLVFLICMLLTLVLGIGYAVLSQQLKIDGSVNYGTMAWDVGFTTAEDGGGSIASSPTVSEDKKSISITCNVGTSTSSETCIAKAKVKNASTFAVKLESDPTITYDSSYISSVTSVWSDNSANIMAGDTLNINEEKEIIVTITTKQLTEDMLPESNLSFPVNITMNWIELAGTDISYDWSGKSAVFIGDSITFGASTTKTYWQYLNEDLDLSSAVNMGINSSTISANSDYGTTKSPLINRYTTVPESDLITIFMGTNDYGHETPLGTINDATDVSFYGALNVIIPWLLENRPNSRIVIMTPIHRYGFGTSGILGTSLTYDNIPNGRGATLGDYVNALKEIANKYSLPVIDLYNLFKLDPTIESVRTQYMPDGLHPNAAGHRLLADTISNALKYISPKESSGNNDNENNDKITMQLGNKYYYANVNDTNRISAVKNVYLNAGTVIKINNSSKYMFGVFAQSSETVTTAQQGGTAIQAWTISDFIIPSDGWYGIAVKTVNDSNFDLGGTDPIYLDDYVSYTKKNTENLDVTMQLGNKYYYANVNDTNRISAVKNVYLNAGTVIRINNSSKYMFGVFAQSSETITTSNDGTSTLQAWTINDFIIPSDGWYGIAVKTVNDSNFDLGGTDSKDLDDYVSFINDSIEATMQLGNKFDSGYINALNRATASENVYLKSGTIISLKDSTKYNYGLIKQDSKTIVLGTNYLTGGWTANNYTITTDGWYGITIKRVDNADFNLGGTDPNVLTGYIIFE